MKFEALRAEEEKARAVTGLVTALTA